jgi:oligopeptide/dipeptide ABC transporter ATP-binding protein
VTLLEVRNLRVQVPIDGGYLQVLDEISFKLEAGETLAMVGESGSGKSMTALAMMGMLPPRSRVETGEILLEGRNLLALGERQWRKVRGAQLAMVYQDASAALHPLMTVGDQLVEAVRAHASVSRTQARERAERTLAEVGIAAPGQRLSAWPHELSGGMRQRVLIAMALLAEPKVLIADEPTTAVDVTLQAQIVELLEKLRRERNLAVLWITHDLGLVARTATRVAVVYAGRTVEIAQTEELFRTPLHPYTLGLLRSSPAALRGRERRPHERGGLFSIPGAAPDPSRLPFGCAFHARCPFAQARCSRERPELRPWRVDVPRLHTGLITTSARRSACFEQETVAQTSILGQAGWSELEQVWSTKVGRTS